MGLTVEKFKIGDSTIDVADKQSRENIASMLQSINNLQSTVNGLQSSVNTLNENVTDLENSKSELIYIEGTKTIEVK